MSAQAGLARLSSEPVLDHTWHFVKHGGIYIYCRKHRAYSAKRKPRGRCLACWALYGLGGGK